MNVGLQHTAPYTAAPGGEGPRHSPLVRRIGIWSDFRGRRLKAFIYCEWIDDDRLYEAMPGVAFLGKAWLSDHRLDFRQFTEDAGDRVFEGGCHLAWVHGAAAPGLLYEFGEADVMTAERLSRVAEGRYVGRGYQVVDEAGTVVSAVAYVLKHPLGPSRPSPAYAANMVRGAKLHALGVDYIERLSGL